MNARGLMARSAVYVTAVLLAATTIFIAAEKARTTTTESSRAHKPASSRPALGANSLIAGSFGKLPLAFEANQGQTDPQVRYISRGQGYQLFLTPAEAVLELRQPKPANAQLNVRGDIKATIAALKSREASVLRLQFAGANAAPKVLGIDQLPGKTNYFVGNNPSKWHTGVPNYSRVSYHEIYPGVDLAFYGNGQRLEYDFTVAPGADPKEIALEVQGARNLRVDDAGNLVLAVSQGAIQFEKPLIYQNVNGQRKFVAGNYNIASNQRVGFTAS